MKCLPQGHVLQPCPQVSSGVTRASEHFRRQSLAQEVGVCTGVGCVYTWQYHDPDPYLCLSAFSPSFAKEASLSP